MQQFLIPGWTELAMATAAAAVLGYLLCWLLDLVLLKRLMDDRLAGIALGCGIAFLMMMGALSWAMTVMDPWEGGPIVVPPIGYAIGFILALAGVGVLRVILWGRAYQRGEEQAVFEPDYNDWTVHEEEVADWNEKNAGRNYLRRHWSGHLSLPVSYWVNGALVSVLLVGSAELITEKLHRGGGSLRTIALVALAYFAVSILVWVWSSVGIWRSAYWHRRRGGTAGWGLAARILVLLGVVSTIVGSKGLAMQAAEYGNLALGRDSLGPVAEMTIPADGARMLLRGTIAEGAADRFRAVLDANPGVREIVLTSYGGRMLEAERMAALIDERGLDTSVDDYCMSACVSLLLAGDARSAPNRARVGFHQPSFPGMGAADLRDSIEEVRAQYIAAGVDEGLVWRALATPANDMWFPSREELIAGNVLTGSEIVISGSRPGSHKQAAAAEESLSDKRLRGDLQLTARQMTNAAPTRVDEVTTMDRAVASGLTLTTYYTLKIPNLDRRQAKPVLTRALQADMCGRPDVRNAIRDGATFVHSYRDGSGKQLFEIAIRACTEA